MSVCRLAWFQSGVRSVYVSHLPSGLGVGDPTSRWYCLSRNVIGRRTSDEADFCASAVAGISVAMKRGWMRMTGVMKKEIAAVNIGSEPCQDSMPNAQTRGQCHDL